MKQRSSIEVIVEIWRAIPLKLVLLLIVLSLVLKNPDGRAEFYPFSNYPMYSQFDESDYFVYIADQNGEALPSKATFRITTPKIKKRFKKELKKVADKLDIKKSEVDGADLERVAVTTLKSLNNAVPDHPRVAGLSELQLIYVDLLREGDAIVIKERKIGSIVR